MYAHTVHDAAKASDGFASRLLVAGSSDPRNAVPLNCNGPYKFVNRVCLRSCNLSRNTPSKSEVIHRPRLGIGIIGIIGIKSHESTRLDAQTIETGALVLDACLDSSV